MIFDPSQLQYRTPFSTLINGQAGQGVVFLATMLATAAASAGKKVAQTTCSSAAVRSGSSIAHVIMSDTFIDFPYIEEKPDALIALCPPPSPFSADAKQPINDNGVIVFDASLIEKTTFDPEIAIPIETSPMNSVTTIGPANMMLLGAFVQLTAIFPLQLLCEIVERHPKSNGRSDRRNVEKGAKLAQLAMEQRR